MGIQMFSASWNSFWCSLLQLFVLAVQHERKPIVDRKEQHKSSTSENDQEIMSQSKTRLKKDANSDSVNYLSLFQLNPLLMHAASNAPQPFQPTTKTPECGGIKMEETFIDDLSEDRLNTNNDSTALFDTVLEQKQLNDTFDLISLIESSLQNGFEAPSNGNSLESLPQSFLNNLTDESVTQFKIQLPNVLPKMHFVCEVGSRVLFKTFDWLRDIHILQHFASDIQVEMLKLSWAELLVLGLAQIVSSSQQAAQLKSMIISSLVNYVKSLIICSANETNQMKSKVDLKPASGKKLKKMLVNIMTINKFIDAIIQLDLDGIEFAHLRILCLFNPNKLVYSSETKVKNCHQRIAGNLQDYLQNREKSRDITHKRIVSMYQTLSILPSLDNKIIEKLFFNILVDFIRIENVIPYIINLNEAGDPKHDVKKEKEFDDENHSHSMNSDDQRYYSNYSGDEK